MSYNILADCYTGKEGGGHLNKNHLDFKSRSDRIKMEISQGNADIVGLQELDHKEIYCDYLTRLGYQFVTE